MRPKRGAEYPQLQRITEQEKGEDARTSGLCRLPTRPLRRPTTTNARNKKKSVAWTRIGAAGGVVRPVGAGARPAGAARQRQRGQHRDHEETPSTPHPYTLTVGAPAR